ncbi:cyclopropane-fatty-acyl-phospholipid synthase [Arenicella chitinivorans]|uniref:Cyclopropane-fatty-acyl-phospholipid synthase n=1 Tax=Arenicella chitinivorans TaxID=1329800 RepID=A0A918VQP0_9GAMM|nr:cyclopropane-fatty-acyl-phospholipid synthase family protein [Arenicella chitinivorans]GHA15357.1 cyclopropane-fatty-acyl-phospholipid synthase [Arenicella chitinivorans]
MTTDHYSNSPDINAVSEPELIPSIFAQSRQRIFDDANHRAIDRFFRSKYIELFQRLESGCITVIDPLGTIVLGDPDAKLQCTMTIFDLRSYTKVALGGSNGSAQAYIEGLWRVDNLSHLIRIFVINRVVLEEMESGLAKIAQYVLRVWHHLFRRNTVAGSRKNIADHYDLGNEFFRLFLDERMMYSSALYQPGDDLNSASERKLQRICDVLALSSEDHVVEIGSGWGGFACYAARTTGCQVTTVTISQEQYDEAVARVMRENLSDQVTVKLQDYRDVEGTFDKLVSIEMIEAIGHQYLDTYFRKLNHLLKPNGKALVQAIVIDDNQYQKALKEVDYIKRYIFPGGFMPCYSVISQFAGNNRLMLEDLHDMGLSYAQTLRDWRKRFYHRIDDITQQGYDAAFQRMWEFYLCYCEGAFDERAISVGQILLRKQAHAD